MKRKPLPESQRVLTFVSASELLAKPATMPDKNQPACQTASPTVKSPTPPPIVIDVCEFVGDYVFPGSSGRKCFDGTFCPVSVYGKLTVYQTCPTRLLKLRERKEQP